MEEQAQPPLPSTGSLLPGPPLPSTGSLLPGRRASVSSNLGDPFKQHVAQRLQSLRALITAPPNPEERQSLLEANDTWQQQMEAMRTARDAELDKVLLA